MHIYNIISWIKFVLGVAIMVIVYTSINIYEDPVIWIGLWFLWLFIASRWISFFLFLWIQNIYRHVSKLRLVKDSYKLSLLFWIYVMVNVILIMSEYRNKFIWILLIVGFILLQISLFSDHNNKHEDE